jgi:hypothetical protein
MTERRVDIGRVVRRVFRIYVDEASVLMPAAAVVFVFTGIIGSLLVESSRSYELLALLIDLVAMTVFTGMIVELVADLRDGRRDASALSLLRAVGPVFGQLLAVALVAAVGVIAGLILFILPGLYLITVWSVSAPVVVIERPPGLSALRRSRELVQGNAWRVFAVILLLTILVSAAAIGIDIAAETAGKGAGLATRVVIGVLIAPISALSQAVLYFELRGEPASQEDQSLSPAAPS